MRTTQFLLLGAPSVFALRPNMAVSIGEVFWPPTMNYAVWLPGDENCICSNAVAVNENKVFSIGGEDGFTYDGFWGNSMKLMKNGIEIADCSIGPDAVKQDICERARDSNVHGIVTKRWNCWMRAKDMKMDDASKGGSGTRGGVARPYWES